MSDELKPCPFCGRDAVLETHSDYHAISTMCGHIVDFDQASAGPLVDLVSAWNTRVESPELAELRAELGRMKSFHTCAIHGDINWKQWGCPDCVHDLRDEVARLRKNLYAAVRTQAHKRRKTMPMWIVAQDVTALGATSSCELCRELGIDPNQYVKDFLSIPYAWPTEDCEPLPPPPKRLPTIDEMSGLVSDFTDGKSLKEYMDELSDE